MRALLIVPLLLGAVLPWTPAAADVFRPDHICGPARIEDARVSPDGSAVAYVLRSCSLESNEIQRDLWYVSTEPDSPGPVQLTTSARRDQAPRWSPDGTSLAFLSTRSGSMQIWCFDGLFGEPRQVTDQPGGVWHPVWLPDGSGLLYLSRGEPAAEADVLAGEDVAVHRDLLYRKGAFREQGRFAQVHRVPAAGGEGRRLSHGEHEHGEFAVSPDGKTVAVVREPEHVGEYSIDTGIWLLPSGGGAARLLTDNEGPDHYPAWSPDGAVIYTRSILEAGYESGRRRVLAWPVGGGEPTEITDNLDHHVFRYQVADDGTLILVVDHEGTWQLGQIDPALPGQMTPLTTGAGWLWGFHTSGGTTVALATAADHPSELWQLELGGEPVPLAWDDPAGKRFLTGHNAGFEGDVRRAAPRAEWVESPSGARIQVWYYPPAWASKVRPPPLVVTLHGGPQWCVGERWDPEIQALSGAGYAVLAVNFTGSLGYGQAFVDAIAGDWGGAPYQDVIAAVDWAVDNHLADPARLGITGGSYGGFLAGFAIGQSDRFGAAVLARAVTEQVSEYGTTDEQFFAERDLQGTPWTNPDGYARWSPLTYAPQVQTPTMLIHSENDDRVPLNQAEQLFTALIVHGVEAELVVFPGEGHGLSRNGTPVHRRERLRHMIRWFDEHLK